MEESLFKTNFIGRDGFRWWIGQIAPDEVQTSQTKEKKGWGNRYKVRILGYHPYNNVELKDEELPWATVISPPGHGTGSGGISKTLRFQQGDTVIGFFLDGDNAQVPMIFGAFGNSAYVPTDEPGPFKAFTGYTSTHKRPAATVANTPSESTGAIETPAASQISQSDADKVASTTGSGNRATMSSYNGKVVYLGCGKSQSQESISKMKVGVQNLVADVTNLKSKFSVNTEFYRDKVKGLVSDKTSALAGNASGLVSGMTNSVYKQMTPMLNGGLKSMYSSVYAKTFAATKSAGIANKFGTAAQESMINPIGSLNGLLPCLTNQVIGNLSSSIEGILNSVVDNVFNYVDCVGDQATGALMNAITGQISDGMQSSLGGIGKLMGYMGNFSVDGLLRGGVDSLLGMAGMGDCLAAPPPPAGACTYKMGQGPVSGGSIDLSSIIKDANTAKAVADAAAIAGVPLDGIQDIMGGFSLLSGGIKEAGDAISGIGDAVSECNSALPEVCEPPKINIFGGGGTGASAVPFFGNFNFMGQAKKTGSVIGIKMTNPGNGYMYPPFVEIVDNCGQGFGAIARATIKDGKVNEIYIVSEGLYYPISDDVPPIIDTVTIVNPGYGYEDGDTVTDNLGNEYDTKISYGSIIKVTPINSKDIDELPILTVNSKTGSGAILKANLDVRPETPQGEIKQVIDCINT